MAARITSQLPANYQIAAELIKRIEYVLDPELIAVWQAAMHPLSFNRYEGQALRGFFEEMHHLIDRRDDVDKLRAEFATDPLTLRQRPDESQRIKLYSRTKIYFDTYYGALSHLSSVVARFSRIFGGVAHSDNKSFLTWLERFCGTVGTDYETTSYEFESLEAARLFRAVLNHPQQFSPPDWSTETRSDYDVVHLFFARFTVAERENSTRK